MNILIPKNINPYTPPNIFEFFIASVISLIVALIATIPWIIAASTIHLYIGLLAYLIGIGAYSGYLWGTRGKSKYALFVVIPVTIFAVFFAEIVDIFIIIYKFTNRIDFNVFLSIFRSGGFTNSGELANLGIGLLIAFLGIYSLITRIRKTNNIRV